MFGQNEIVGRKYFDGHGDKMFVTSVFYTIQGEGPLMGYPAVFVRLAKCNLDCSFCDAYFDAGDWMSPGALEAKIIDVLEDAGKKVSDANGMALVITGGEPMLQKNMVDWLNGMIRSGITGCSDLLSFGWYQIETNGTQSLKELHPLVVAVVSPKVSEKSGRYLKPQHDVLKRADALKFVVEAPVKDRPMTAYESVPDWAMQGQTRSVNVFVSPINVYNQAPLEMKILMVRDAKTQNIDFRSTKGEVASFWEPGLLDMKANQANHEHAARLCMKHGYRLNLQQHIYCSLA